MTSTIGGILKASHRDDTKPLDILTFCTHERFEPNLCLTGHNFYGITGQGIKGWNTKSSPIPDNYRIVDTKGQVTIDSVINNLPIDLEFDCIIAQNRFGHVQIGKVLQQYLGIPMISIEHTDIMPVWPEEHIQHMTTLVGDIEVYITEYSKNRWRSTNGLVIEHMINTDLFCPSDKPRANYILSMCNDFINRDLPCGFTLWRKLVQQLPYVIVGDTPGLSRGTNSIAECVMNLQNAQIFLNTSQFSPTPMSLLEAMACECAVVSTATCAIPDIIENGVNGFCSNDETELRHRLEQLLHDPDMARRLGKNARQTILERFNKDRFLNSWNQIFDDIKQRN